MEVYLSRTEIRRQVAAILGETTSTAQASQVQNQRNTLIDSATRRVATDCRWVNTQRRSTVDLGIQQNVVDYPDGCSSGGVLAMAVYDPNSLSGNAVSGYIKLEKRFAPPEADQDQQQAAGGDAFQAVCGIPQYWWEEQGQIHLWPYSDVAYKLRLHWIAQVTFTADDVVSIVDGLMVVYFTLYMVCSARGDRDMAQVWMAEYTKRNNDLKSWQATGQIVEVATDASFDENRDSWYSGMPRWDQSPTVR